MNGKKSEGEKRDREGRMTLKPGLGNARLINKMSPGGEERNQGGGRGGFAGGESQRINI